MGLVDLTWTVVPFLEALDSFIVVLTGLCKTSNQTFGCLVLDGILQLFFLGNGCSIVN